MSLWYYNSVVVVVTLSRSLVRWFGSSKNDTRLVAIVCNIVFIVYISSMVRSMYIIIDRCVCFGVDAIR